MPMKSLKDQLLCREAKLPRPQIQYELKRSVTTLLVSCTLIAGCSNMTQADVKKRDGEKVQDEAERLSSEILNMLSLKGHVSKAGSSLVACSDHPRDQRVYRARHPWSITGPPITDLKKAFGRVRDELPRNHWKIVKEGHDDSVAKNLQVVANHKDKDFSVDIRLDDEEKFKPEDREGPSMIEVTVVSGCFKKT